MFSAPFEIIKTKIGETININTEIETPFDKVLNIYDLDDQLIDGPINFDLERNDNLFWFVSISSLLYTTKTYYKFIVSDPDLTGELEETFIVYVTDEKDFEDMVDRSAGLVGKNARYFSYVWTRGQLTQFDIKLYANSTDLNNAKNGVSDNFTAYYRVEISYDANYNPTILTSKKQ